MNLAIEGYRRRRAWAAFHAGYGFQAKDAKFEHLMGRNAQRRNKRPEDMMQAMGLHMSVRRAAAKARARSMENGDG